MKKKFILLIVILFIILLIFFFIGFFKTKIKTQIMNFNQDKQLPTIITESTLNQLSQANSTSSISTFNNTLSPIDFQIKINKEIDQLTSKIKEDTNQSITKYNQQVLNIIKNQPTIEYKNNQKVNINAIIDTAKQLSNINPPPLLYHFHIELIKTYYTVGKAMEEFQNSNDPVQKLLLYNLIKNQLEKLKF
jgi:peptidoglycan hydrolase CwlO-like protein